MRDLIFAGLELNGREKWVVAENLLMRGVHPRSEQCEEFGCVIHQPSEHHMRDWQMDITGPGGVIVRQCEHGEWHPDPDSLAYFKRLGLSYDHDGCDRCCND